MRTIRASNTISVNEKELMIVITEEWEMMQKIFKPDSRVTTGTNLLKCYLSFANSGKPFTLGFEHLSWSASNTDFSVGPLTYPVGCHPIQMSESLWCQNLLFLSCSGWFLGVTLRSEIDVLTVWHFWSWGWKIPIFRYRSKDSIFGFFSERSFYVPVCPNIMIKKFRRNQMISLSFFSAAFSRLVFVSLLHWAECCCYSKVPYEGYFIHFRLDWLPSLSW